MKKPVSNLNELMDVYIKYCEMVRDSCDDLINWYGQAKERPSLLNALNTKNAYKCINFLATTKSTQVDMDIVIIRNKQRKYILDLLEYCDIDHNRYDYSFQIKNDTWASDLVILDKQYNKETIIGHIFAIDDSHIKTYLEYSDSGYKVDFAEFYFNKFKNDSMENN